MKTEDGTRIIPDRLFRTGHLADLTENDVLVLETKIGTVIDFRSGEERTRQPDREIPGVENIHLPIVDSLTGGISREEEADRDIFKRYMRDPEAAKAYMCGMYEAFTNDFQVSQYSRFLRRVTETDRGILWHCTAGKDRAGIGSVLVEEILGVSREDIFEDYLKTNLYIEDDIRFLTAFIKKKMREEGADADNAAADASLRCLFGADIEYIESYYKAVEQKYGGMKQFLADGLNVSEADIRIMREKYLEK